MHDGFNFSLTSISLSLMTNNVRHIFMSLFAIADPSFVNYLCSLLSSLLLSPTGQAWSPTTSRASAQLDPVKGIRGGHPKESQELLPKCRVNGSGCSHVTNTHDILLLPQASILLNFGLSKCHPSFKPRPNLCILQELFLTPSCLSSTIEACFTVFCGYSLTLQFSISVYELGSHLSYNLITYTHWAFQFASDMLSQGLKVFCVFFFKVGKKLFREVRS